LYTEEIPRDTALDPIIACHCHEIANADGIIIVHPNWWGQPPAILKGWVDRVIRPGIAYRFLEGDNGEGIPVGLLKARAVIVFNTANTPEERENAVFGDPLERIWKDCIFDLCGVSQFHRRMFRIIVTSDEIRRASWLTEVKEMVVQAFPKE
jgi:NAD(P)H dehydrogenase (quinone)